jgi:putative chitinase
MNVNDLAALAQRPVSEVAPWLQPIAAAMDEFQIDSAARQAAFLAQIVHESDGLGRVVENLRSPPGRGLAAPLLPATR